jgi:hypothetical protein
MSIKVLGMVWKCSRAKCGDLLVALAIADFADDEGNAYPSIATLSKKSRLSDRQVKRAIKNLEILGELRILRGTGPFGTNRYQLRGDSLSCVDLSWGVANEAEGGDICDIGGVTPMSPNPSEETIRRNRHVRNGAGFDKFWSLYPRKKSKKRAQRVWNTLKPDEQLQDRIFDAIERAKTSVDWRKEGGKWVPYPATWLHDEGWEDEDTSTTSSSSHSVCAEKVLNDRGRGYDPCGKPIDSQQSLPILPFCAEHLPRRLQLNNQLEGRP